MDFINGAIIAGVSFYCGWLIRGFVELRKHILEHHKS